MSRMVEMAAGRWAHASGALWLAGSGTLLVADAHLGYGWAMRRRGQLGPVHDEEAVRKLREVVSEMQPRHVVFLGDLVHAPRPSPAEFALLNGALEWLIGRAKVTLVEGNHDRGFRRDFGHLAIDLCREWIDGQMRAIHGDRAGPDTAIRHTVAGHFHPSLSLRDASGANHRLPVFLHDDGATVMPAFSPFAAGGDIRRGVPETMLGLFSGSGVGVVAASGKQAKALRPFRLTASARAQGEAHTWVSKKRRRLA